MKKVFSAMLVLCIFLLISAPALASTGRAAVGNNLESSFPIELPSKFEIGDSKYGNWAWLNTDEYVATIIVKPSNDVTLSYLEKAEPSTVYEYRLKSSDFQSFISETKFTDTLSSELTTATFKTFNTEAAEPQSDSEQWMKNTMVNMLADKYEDAYSIRLMDTYEYSGIFIRINETLTLDTAEVGTSKLTSDMEIATAITELVGKFDISHKQAWEGLSKVLGVSAKLLTVVGRELDVQDYRGIMLYYRDGWAKPAYSSEDLEMYTTATKTYVNHIFIDRDALYAGSADPDEVFFILEEDREVVYIPSEYGFSTDGLCEKIARYF